MKAIALGMAGFVLMAAVAIGGYVAYQQYQKERFKEAILGQLACESPAVIARFNIQCVPPAPPAPTTKKE